MPFIRVVDHAEHVDFHERRLKSTAFGGDNQVFSVFDKECALGLAPGSTVCGHIRMHYSDVAGEPVLFIELTPESLQRRHREAALRCGAAPDLKISFVRQQDEGRTDVCHHNVCGLTRRQARRLARAIALEELEVCPDGAGDSARVTADLVDELARSAEARQTARAARTQSEETSGGRRHNDGK